MQKILLRADSSSKIGLGHIMRDLVLVKQFKNSSISFATQNLQGNINTKILESGYKVIKVKSNNKKELVALIKDLKIDLLIIDHYDIDFDCETYIKKHTKVKIFVLDDTYEEHNCDILLNHNIGANKKRYKELVPKSCELRCGTKYTLLRDEFYAQKKKIKRTQKKKTIFIAMGATDEKNISEEIIKVLKEYKGLRVNLVTSSSNKNLITLKKYVKNKKWVNLYIDSKKIAQLMRKSDFAIVSPSVILNEVYFMELPFLAIKTASNQDDIYKYLKKEKYLTLKKFDAKKLEQKIKVIL